MSDDLFTRSARDNPAKAPLAERMRPTSIDDIIGQDHLLGSNAPLGRLIAAGALPSCILWGPPGVGKTSLAKLLAQALGARLEAISAVSSGVRELRDVVDSALRHWGEYHQRTLLFVDEIHRFNRAQQDALLPDVESGRVTLVGATTENPSFEINSALLSRLRVFVLRDLSSDDLKQLLARALNTPQGLGDRELAIDVAAEAILVRHCDGDARRALNTLEIAAELTVHDSKVIQPAQVEDALQHQATLYDKSGDAHYDIVSAFIKSMRGSDPDAAIYWLTRMLEGGEDPRFILRRMVIFASEDIGNADPRALGVATAALHAYELVGLPEGALCLAQATTYLACAAKSNASYLAYLNARREVRESGSLPVPAKLRNAPTALSRQLGHGRGYLYPHDYEDDARTQDYLPDQLIGRRYYHPRNSGEERQIGDRHNSRRTSPKPD